MLRTLTLGLCLLLPVQASALSCVQLHVEDAYNKADASPDPYVIVIGTLDFQADDLPKVDWRNQQDVPPETQVEARLAGTVLGQSGQSAPFDEPLRLIVNCSGPWCPHLVPGAEYLAFAKKVGDSYELRLGACGGMIFQEPSAAILQRLQVCLDGDDCTPPAR